jgi:DNA-binding response OmpR family regulator
MTPPAELSPVRKPTVLLVEDDNVTIHLVSHILEREGFEVMVMRDGREASAHIDRSGPPDLVLTDIMLPYHSGFELIRLIREREGWSDVPIVALTSKSQEKDIVRALGEGADDYVIKPFRPEELLARVRRLRRSAA